MPRPHSSASGAIYRDTLKSMFGPCYVRLACSNKMSRLCSTATSAFLCPLSKSGRGFIPVLGCRTYKSLAQRRDTIFGKMCNIEPFDQPISVVRHSYGVCHGCIPSVIRYIYICMHTDHPERLMNIIGPVFSRLHPHFKGRKDFLRACKPKTLDPKP